MGRTTKVLRRRRKHGSGSGHVFLIGFQVIGIFVLVITAIVIGAAVTGVVAAGGLYTYITKDLPDPANIELVETDTDTAFQTTKLYDRTGQIVLYEVIDPYGGDRQWVHLDEIPQSL
ncbi:MAG: hypothetical protein ABFQ89_01360, partial [Chloroflexota bacterium]